MTDPLLAESARLAHRWAGEQCATEPGESGTCAWYHGFWPFMRLMGLAKTSGGHSDFLTDALRQAARRGDGPRALVSGAADHAMAACVLNAYRLESAPLALSMVDRCPTPLALARWYAQRRDASIATIRADILAFEGDAGYDVIVTNSFLGYFDPPARRRLFARWAALLRRGGWLILTNRLRPGDGHEPVGFTAAQARAFIDAVRREGPRLQPELNLEPAELVRLARAYAARFRSVPLRSADEVLDLLSGSGFQPVRLETAAAAGLGGAASLAGPTLAEAADYVRLAAMRR